LKLSALAEVWAMTKPAVRTPAVKTDFVVIE
jgi:hypothetical protein